MEHKRKTAVKRNQRTKAQDEQYRANHRTGGKSRGRDKETEI